MFEFKANESFLLSNKFNQNQNQSLKIIFRNHDIDSFQKIRLIDIIDITWNDAWLDITRPQPVNVLMHSYGFCTPVTQRQVLIKINFQAPKTIQTNYWQPPDCGLIIRWSHFIVFPWFLIFWQVTQRQFWP